MGDLKGVIGIGRVRDWPQPIAQLAPIGNRALISYALRVMVDSGVREVGLFGTAHACDQVRALLGASCDGDLSFEVIEQPDTSHPRADAAALERFADGAAVLVHPGNALVGVTLADLLDEVAAGAVDAAVVVGDPQPARGVAPDVIGLERRRIARLIAKLAPGPDELLDTGVRVLGPRYFEAARTALPGRRPGEMSGALTQLLSTGGNVVALRAPAWWSFDGTLDGLLEGNRRVLDVVVPRVADESLEDTRVQGRARIHPTARIESSTIRGPVVVGPGAHVVSSYIGPYTAIGESVSVRGAEIENSIVLPRARIEFIGRRIEASIVGADAHISRDFSLPKAVRLWVGDHAEVCLT